MPNAPDPRQDDLLAQFLHANEAAIKGGEAVLKALLLINGGAAVSILAFIGGPQRKTALGWISSSLWRTV